MKLIFYLLLIYLSYSCTGRLRPVQPVYNDSINQQLWSADWSPDNKFIAVGGVDSMVRIYHAHNLRLYKSFFIPSWIHVVKWNRDGSLLAIATSTDYVHVLDMHSGLLRKLDNYPHGSDNSGNGSRAMGWNYTGDMLAVGGLDGMIKIWNREGILMKYVNKYPAGTNFVSYLALDWHPHKNIFTACNFEIQIYDSALQELKVMKHSNPEAIMLCVKWHPGGDFFVIGDYGYNWEGKNVPSLLHFWSSEGHLHKSIYGSKAEYRNIDWSPDGEKLATASDVLRIWTKDGQLLHEAPADGTNYLWGIGWNHSGTRIVTSAKHKTISLWDSTARLLKTISLSDK